MRCASSSPAFVFVWNGPDADERKVACGDELRVVAEHRHLQRVLGKARLDELRQRHRHLLRGRYAILPVENHGVRNVHQHHRRARCGMFALVDFQVLLVHLEALQPVPAHGVVDRAREVDIRHHVAELEAARFRQLVTPFSRVRCAVVAPRAVAAQRAEDLLEGVRPYLLLALVRQLELHPLGCLADKPLVLQVILEGLEVKFLVEEPVAPAEVIQPLQRLLHIARTLRQQVGEELADVLQRHLAGNRVVPL